MLVRGKKVSEVIYGFGDASGGGFGATWVDREKSTSEIQFRLGVWKEEVKNKLSNFKELTNLVESLEAKAKEGVVKGKEIFLCTDNATCESAFYKENSDPPLLFELVLRLKVLCIREGMRLHLVHVASMRMIDQGMDEISRVEIVEGVMSSKPMLDFIPLEKGS